MSTAGNNKIKNPAGSPGGISPAAVPDRILQLGEQEQLAQIRTHKDRLGNKLVILGHHYQRASIISVADHIGDSFALAAHAASQQEAEFIVFCGVHFMAESARVLASPGQRVFIPNPEAGCPLADMAEVEDVETAWEFIEGILGKDSLVPVTYMNSTAELKSFCGFHGGAVCTSSNAGKVFKWVLDSGKKILFFPDEHLGRNTANALGIPGDRQFLWDPGARPADSAAQAVEQADVILWKGFCHVHTHFTSGHMQEMREKYPEGKIVVHPECSQEVMAAADASGSTSFICNFVKQAATGSTVLIATEINLVSRLADEYPDKTILPVTRSLCPNMYRINTANLLHLLDNLGHFNEVFVGPEAAKGARLALDRMLKLA
jgi:quinolinate synthase